ncbi:DNA excision repair protein (Rad26L) [Penicillium pulvis]|uniref:DNA excision repair protein (Rad26L) n=1 Tax=Penicillium pulvis TaxID=1562058 RepID=UPI002547298D|nr:DNA excision repair protein (Rad26L) [Penicillium pulvis]KAJ5798855.1 DNA excision repair protein (Rad26L) [Penicillium pulvis]
MEIKIKRPRFSAVPPGTAPDSDIDIDDDEGVDVLNQSKHLIDTHIRCSTGQRVDGRPKPHTPNTSHKHDPVQAILSSAEGEYTHLNNEVIGSSRGDAKLSRQAEQVNNDPGADFQVFEGSSQMQPDDDQTRTPRPRQPDHSPFRFKYHPPEGVKRCQFCSMAQRLGFADATEFALVVESMTPAERRACLDRWYSERRDVLLSKDEKTKTEKIKDEHIKNEQIKGEDIKDEMVKDENIKVERIKSEIKDEIHDHESSS